MGHVQPPRNDINNFFDFLWRLAITTIEAQQSTHLHSDDWHRTIYIDSLVVKTTDFNLTDLTKKKLLEPGRNVVKHYFDN